MYWFLNKHIYIYIYQHVHMCFSTVFNLMN